MMSVGATEGPSIQEFSARVLHAMKQACKIHGGPRQFLQNELESLPKQKDFFEWLMQALPFGKSVAYQAEYPLPEVDFERLGLAEKPFLLHPAAFSWEDRSSLKGPPDSKVCLQLAEEILTDGFLTANDSVLVAPMEPRSEPLSFGPPLPASPGQQAIAAFSIGYVKGSARIMTLMAMLLLFAQDQINVLKEP